MTPRGDSAGLRRGSADSPGAIAGQLVRGARVAIWWSHDEAWYRGELKQYDSYHKRSKILYDDLLEEWLALPRAKFQCLLPRARSAGCTPACIDVMRGFGAVNVPFSPQESERQPPADRSNSAPAAAADQSQPTGPGLVGWRLTITSPATLEQYKGELIGFRKDEGGQHLVLYDDGEDEWISVAQEQLQEQMHWQAPQPGPPACPGPGIPPGDNIPRGKASVGWRVGVYWKDDQKFYYGEVVSYDPSSGRSTVVYTDGEREPIVLAKEKVKWVLPPGVRATEDVVSDSDGEGGPQGRPVLRGHSSRKWDDDESESSEPCPPARGVALALAARSYRGSPQPPQPQFVRSLGPLRSLKSRLGARLPIRRIRVFCQATEDEATAAHSGSHMQAASESGEMQADAEASGHPARAASATPAAPGPEANDVCLLSMPHPPPEDAELLQAPHIPPSSDAAASSSAPRSPKQPPESSPCPPHIVTTMHPPEPSPRVSSLDILPAQRPGWGAASRNSSTGWSSPGIAHYLAAELPTAENGLASSLKILSRADSGAMCLGYHDSLPRKDGLMKGTLASELYHSTSLGKGPSTPILVEELCARLTPLQRLDSCLNPPPPTAQPSPEPCWGISGSHTPATGTTSPTAPAGPQGHPAARGSADRGPSQDGRTSLERLHPQHAAPGQAGPGRLAAQPVVCGGAGMLANLGSLLGHMGGAQEAALRQSAKRGGPSSCRASAEAQGCSQPLEGLLGGEALASDAKRMKLAQQC